MDRGKREHNSNEMYLPIKNNQVETLIDTQADTMTDLSDLEPTGEVKGGPTKRVWDYIRVS